MKWIIAVGAGVMWDLLLWMIMEFSITINVHPIVLFITLWVLSLGFLAFAAMFLEDMYGREGTVPKENRFW